MLRKGLLRGLTVGACLGGSLVAAAAGPFFMGGGSPLVEEPPAIAGAPFSAVVTAQSVTVFTDGNRIMRSNTVNYFRDGQGRTRIERGEGPEGAITINDPVSAERYFVHPEAKMVLAVKTSAGGSSPSLPSGLASSDDDQVPFALLGLRMAIGANQYTEASSATTSLGQKTVNGLVATGTHLVRTIPSGALGNEKPITSTIDRWFSQELGIAVQITQKSSIGGDVTLNVGHVMRAEPDPTLFAPPAGYTVHSINESAGVASFVGPNSGTTTAVKKDGANAR